HRGAEVEDRRLPHADAQPHARATAAIRTRTRRTSLRVARAGGAPRRQPLPPRRRGPGRLHRRLQLCSAVRAVRMKLEVTSDLAHHPAEAGMTNEMPTDQTVPNA